MALGININTVALGAQRSLQANAQAMTTALQRLSSGLRINGARDDAAGLAISDRLLAQVRGANQAARNANDAISLLQTADGSLASVTEKLQRMRVLSVQAGNSINSVSDRQAMQYEVDQLAQEINREAASAKFNGIDMFQQDGASVVSNPDKQAVYNGLTAAGGWLEDAEQMVLDAYGLAGDGATIGIELSTFTDGAGGIFARVVSSVGASGFGTNLKLQVDMADFVPPNLPDGGSAPYYNDRIIAHEMVHAVMARSTNWGSLVNDSPWFVEGAAEFVQGADERVAADIAANGGGAAGRAAIANALSDGFQVTSLDYSAGYAATRYLHEKIQAAGGTGIKAITTYLNQHPAATLDTAIASASSGAYASEAAFLGDFATNGAAFIATFNLANADTGAVGGFDVDAGAIKTASSVVPNTSSRSGTDVLSGFTEAFEAVGGSASASVLDFQVGANPGQTISVHLGSISLRAMQLVGMLDLNQSPAQAIVAIDGAIDYLGAQRATIGAQMSRFGHAIDNLQSSAENLSAARSRIQDADFAIETASLSRAQILQQAGTAMVAQANLLPQGVLALLR